MACADVKEYIKEYENIANEIQKICTDRVCTLDAILKMLENKGIVLGESTLLAAICQIKGMMHFDKMPKYDIGDAVTYKSGRIFKSEKICNLLVEITYERFYLYNPHSIEDQAFREHILSKIEFEIHEQKTITCGSDLRRVLRVLNIPKECWWNYVFLVGDDVHCVLDNGINVNVGKLVKSYKK